MSTSLFYSCKVTKKKPTPFVPRPVELGDAQDEVLTLSQACIPASVPLKPGTRVSLNVKVGDGEEKPVAIATMVVGSLDTVSLSNIINEYTEFTIDGPPKAEVHVTGFFNPVNTGGDDDDDAPGLEQLLGMPSGYTGEDDEEEDDDVDDEDGDDDMEGEEKQPAKSKRRVEITDITDQEEPKKSIGGSEKVASKGSAGKGRQSEQPSGKSRPVGNDTVGKEPVHTKTAVEQARKILAARKEKQEKEDDDDEENEDGDVGEDMEEDDDSGEEDDEDEDEEGDEDEDDDEEEDEPAAEVRPSKNGQSVKENIRTTQQPNARLSGTKREKPSSDSQATPAEPQKRMKNTRFANGFQVFNVHETSNPNAAVAHPGKRISVRYKGTLENGKVFDETKGNKKFTFRLGSGEVIKGWDRGVAGMREGDKRKLVVPPSMAYGESGVKGVIPKNATLTFEVEMVEVKK